jgi:uncharacterized membrane protein
MDYLPLISRWLHILAAMAAVGGPVFIRLALIPAICEALGDEQRRALHERIRQRWSRVVMAAILFLLASGFYNLIQFLRLSHTWGAAWESGSHNSLLYQILFGVKFVLALAVFFIASAVTGRSEVFARFRENAKFWITVNLLLGVLIVCISGQLRMMHIGPNAETPVVAGDK